MQAPDGWTEEKLGDLFEFKNGANTEAVNYGSGIKFVNVMDIFQNDFLTCEMIRESVNLPGKKADLYKLKIGDVLFNRTSETFDEIALSTVYLDTKLAIFGGFVIRGRPTSSRLNHHYCIYCFSTNRVRKELIRRGQGAIRANIGQVDIQHVPLLVPPLPEQQKIAQILSTWDKAIEKLEALIAAKQKRKKALMQQLLTGKKRFAGFEEVWKTQWLGQICKIVKGEQLNKDTLSEVGNYPVINGGVTPSGYGDDFNREANTITISEGGNSCGFVNLIRSRFWSGGHCYTLENVKIFSAYLYQALKLNEHKIMRLRVGSGLPNIQKKDIDKFHLYIPVNKEEQHKIASVLSAADKEIEIHQKQLMALKQQKKGLMQQLLTGKKRVKIDAPEQRVAVGA